MAWTVEFHSEYQKEFQDLDLEVKEAILSYAGLLKAQGPNLARPYADTLHGSDYANMKELRLTNGKEEWRVAYAFDTERQAVLLCGGNKDGANEKRFYKKLIKVADARFKAWQAALAKKHKETKK